MYRGDQYGGVGAPPETGHKRERGEGGYGDIYYGGDDGAPMGGEAHPCGGEYLGYHYEQPGLMGAPPSPSSSSHHHHSHRHSHHPHGIGAGGVHPDVCYDGGEGIIGTAEQPHAPPATVFPESAPRLHVRGDLPVAATALMDLVAHYVSKAGPSLEEEFIHREARNPHFNFLTAPARTDAHNAYYRWRLYSLLNGDAMDRWRAEPFQMEDCPAEAIVWVPPAARALGAEALQGAFVRDDAGTTAGETPGGPRQPVRYPPPSAYALSYELTKTGSSFATLTDEDRAAWEGLLDHTATIQAIIDEFRAKCDKSNTSGGGGEGAAEARGRQLRQHFREAVESAREALLSCDAVAERMAFAVEHAQIHMGGAPTHTTALILDAAARAAFDAASIQTDGAGEPSGDGSSSHTKDATGVAADMLRVALLCVVQLAYLFLLHDIFNNSGARLLLSDEAVEAAETQRTAREEEKQRQMALRAMTGGANLPPPPPPSSSARSATGTAAAPSASSSSSASPLGGGGAAPKYSRRAQKTLQRAVTAVAAPLLEAALITGVAAAATTANTAAETALTPSAPSLRATLHDDAAAAAAAAAAGPMLTDSASVLGGHPPSASEPRWCVSLSLPAAPTASAPDAADAAVLAETQDIGSALVRWTSTFAKLWAGQPDAAGGSGAADAEDEPRRLSSFEGRALAQFVEKYRFLL